MENFKVAIVGGSVAGLALALHLEKLGIDYIVLEAYGEIAPQVGASIGLAPNGLKICQQLGFYDEVKDMSVSVADLVVRNGNGDIIWQHRLFEEIRKQHGYDLLFTERQKFLRAIQSNFQHLDRLLTNQRVVEIEQVGEKVHLHTNEGRMFEADIAIGADGIHSPMRKEMWRLAAEAGSKVFGDDPGAGEL